MLVIRAIVFFMIVVRVRMVDTAIVVIIVIVVVIVTIVIVTTIVMLGIRGSIGVYIHCSCCYSVYDCNAF